MDSEITVILVGTSHSIQIENCEFEIFLRNLCQVHKIYSVAEEMNQEALKERNCFTTIPQKLATSLGLGHRFCDPYRSERSELSILQENDIRAQAFLSKWSEDEIKVRIAENYEKRERYWLEQIRKLNHWPILFVCGAYHVKSFCSILEQENITVHVAAVDWVPT
jgi:hypothetical protein